MKLKKSFWVKISSLAAAVILTSCTSTNLSVPVPGQGSVKTRNIYAEYYMLGDSYYKLEDYKKAAEYYELAMRKKDQYWAAYYKLAKCYVFTSDWNSALPMYKTILERDPENASLKASLAYIYSMKGDFKNSITIYEELLAAQPHNQEYLENYLAVMAADSKKFEKKYAAKFTDTYETLKTEYPENKNLKTFEDKYKELMKIKDEEPEPAAEGEGTETSETTENTEATQPSENQNPDESKAKEESEKQEH